jgi:hypothetical protein
MITFRIPRSWLAAIVKAMPNELVRTRLEGGPTQVPVLKAPVGVQLAALLNCSGQFDPENPEYAIVTASREAILDWLDWLQ